jgi:hypothetical protein
MAEPVESMVTLVIRLKKCSLNAEFPVSKTFHLPRATSPQIPFLTGRPYHAGFVLADVIVAGALIMLFAVATTIAMVRINRTAAVNRNYVAAQAIVRSQIDQAMCAVFTPDTAAAVLAPTVAGADRDGDGEGDGELFQSNVPLLVSRDTLIGNDQISVVAGTLYRHVSVIDATLNLRRISMLLTYPYRGKTYAYRMTTLRAQGPLGFDEKTQFHRPPRVYPGRNAHRQCADGRFSAVFRSIFSSADLCSSRGTSP